MVNKYYTFKTIKKLHFLTNLQKNGIIKVYGGVVDMDIKSWTNHIIEIYNKTETVDVYNRRSNNLNLILPKTELILSTY